MEELEKELREVSSELAGSIRREMELEDEIERFKSEAPTTVSDLTRRTSDYFSDSGASSTRFPLGENDAKIEELERLKRKIEQDKASLQAEYTQKFARELRQRRDLEGRVQELEEEIHEKQQRIINGAQKDGQFRELETSLEDARRRLSQERQSKDNFQDLLAALREELEQHRNERDNLRDEVVPQLKARVEGLEAEMSDHQSLQYENARMQQELQALRAEYHTLLESRSGRPDAVTEEDDLVPPQWPPSGLRRSSSLARGSSMAKRGSSLTRTSSVKERQRSDSIRDDRNKDLEDQRDALHQALKLLISRHEAQKREHSKAIRNLIAERTYAEQVTPRRTAFHREVSHLRSEVSTLRGRANDALEQKWQCEKSISGVKMALDRAEQETKSLRELLEEHDILPRHLQQAANSSDNLGLGISSRNSHGSESPVGQGQRESVVEVLRRSIVAAENDRDAALKEAESYRLRAASLTPDEQGLATDLLSAATTMENLAAQVQRHLESNAALRTRLTDAVAKGEAEQADSTARITAMQERLRSMEERVVAAQQHAEATLGESEDDVKQLEQASSANLARLRITIPEPLHRLSPHSAATATASATTPLFSARTPQLAKTTTGLAESLLEVSRTQVLEVRVTELEKALQQTDEETKDVVERITRSQYEVAALTAERDEAVRMMKGLQAMLEQEKTKGRGLMG